MPRSRRITTKRIESLTSLSSAEQMPSWLLPSALPAFVVKGRIQHAPMVEARAIAITRFNALRKLKAAPKRCAYCGNPVPDSVPHPNVFACCGEIGHVE